MDATHYADRNRFVVPFRIIFDFLSEGFGDPESPSLSAAALLVLAAADIVVRNKAEVVVVLRHETPSKVHRYIK